MVLLQVATAPLRAGPWTLPGMLLMHSCRGLHPRVAARCALVPSSWHAVSCEAHATEAANRVAAAMTPAKTTRALVPSRMDVPPRWVVWFATSSGRGPLLSRDTPRMGRMASRADAGRLLPVGQPRPAPPWGQGPVGPHRPVTITASPSPGHGGIVAARATSGSSAKDRNWEFVTCGVVKPTAAPT